MVIDTNMAEEGIINQPSQIKQYKHILCKFMSFVHGTEYHDNWHFEAEELQQITPQDVYHYLCVQAYGKPDPGPQDFPTGACSTTLLYDKKAISHFMPDNGSNWNEHAQSGNPTCSGLVNTNFWCH